MHYYLKAKSFLTKSGLKNGGFLEIKDGKFGSYLAVKKLPKDAKVIDKGEMLIAPGLVDTHIHGYLGHDVMDGDLNGLSKIAQGLLACGVTSFLPTTLTASKEKLKQVCQLIGQNHAHIKGAKIQGIYLEGPYFTTPHKGAQDPRYMRPADIDELLELQAASGGMIKKIALAPEKAGALDFIPKAVAAGVKVGLGHSDATYEQALAALDHGASFFVHAYNGMSGLQHRAPGMVGALFSTKAYAEMICDGHHIHPGAIQALVNAKTPAKLALVTDCMQAGGMPAGQYKLGEFLVDVKDGAARLQNGGSLAGSVLELFSAVQNLVNWGICSLPDALMMATQIPAQSAEIADVCGKIETGLAADFIVIDPALELSETYVDGELVYQK